MNITEQFGTAFNLLMDQSLTVNAIFPISGEVRCSVRFRENLAQSSHSPKGLAELAELRVITSELDSGENLSYNVKLTIDEEEWTIVKVLNKNNVFTLLQIRAGERMKAK